MTTYSIGVDYGTESARAVLVDLRNGEVVASAVKNYPDGVIDDHLPRTNIKLEADWALQNPNDYVECFISTVGEVVRAVNGKIASEDIIGIGIDFTACTVLPVKADGTPLCNVPSLRDHPHSWVKLWKHHAAQEEANRLNAIAAEQPDSFLSRYGGKISSEWLFPKLWQILNEAPDIYEEMDCFIEATDWIIWQLTGKETRSSCTAGYKALWHKQKGFPESSFFKALDPRLEHVVDEKLTRHFLPVGSKAGGLTAAMAQQTGLLEGTAVAVGNVDAHVSAPPTGITEPGSMLMIMGTSTCDILLSKEEKHVPGICGVVEDGAIPGYFAYESGQSAVGDIFARFIKNAVPDAYFKEASAKGQSIHELLEEKAASLEVGENGLLALDWLNGNRSILVDGDLSGLILGLTLSTKPEEIYRALIEATAYGKRLIIENYEANGVPVNALVACGGLPHKNKMLMQIYADVIGKEISIAEHLQAPAVGAAMFGAVAAGQSEGGYETIAEAAEYMAKLKDEKIKPIPKNTQRYDILYREYKKLHDYFGRGENDVMKVLKTFKK
ncbi:L-ribulokinase [Pullulanibacillus pueri]|uniref:Ribulokinase n=1 Tax=Pullulanibacillus pueri TaxID=1437324 RepID=A0A8J2ZYE9_9BACL|nr:ribulokinase [Pullulanibacillus pueri]MBM7682999.1 L-ribulokinase [Pullulanibacillus pueri]GGH85910.1 ribulokinase [Pullulanibacillus pueri]